MSLGFFITFEGGEGAGKSTQIKRLRDTLVGKGYNVVQTREPGGTPEAEKVRDLLVQRDGGEWSAREECLLLYAARAGHVERVIRPALQSGSIVLCDRFSDSTLVYQGYGRGLDLSFIRSLDYLVLDGLKPDLTFVMDIDPTMGLGRSEKRLASAASSKESHEDRFERLDFSFHKRLRDGFLSLAESESNRCILVDAARNVEELASTIAAQALRKIEGL